MPTDAEYPVVTLDTPETSHVDFLCTVNKMLKHSPGGLTQIRTRSLCRSVKGLLDVPGDRNDHVCLLIDFKILPCADRCTVK